MSDDFADSDLSPGPSSASAAAPAAGGAGAQAQGDAFAIEMVGQEQTNWCWAAVTQAIEIHLRQARYSQEEIATHHISQNRPGASCAPPEASRTGGGRCAAAFRCAAECNGDHDVTCVLGERGIATTVLAEDAPVPFEALPAQIAARRPIICRMAFGNDGHYLCITGWWVAPNGTRQVLVCDPWSQPPRLPVQSRYMPYDEFIADYPANGLLGRNTDAWAASAS
ncbi:MAG TPA: papain-like cysteine protease family protein [Allosphingosinicella sp.]|jgi:hypothetical protein